MDLPLLYSAKEIRARIVDEQTGQPVEGAVVVAQWILAPPSGRGPTLHIAESVTNKQGEFFFEAWGPKPKQPWTYFRHYSPLLSIFKHGYVPLRLHNESIKSVAKEIPNYKNMSTKELIGATSWYEGAPKDSVQDCMWNGLNIQIESYSGNSDRWLELLAILLFRVEQQDDKKVPQFFRAVAAERDYFKANPVSRSTQASLYSFYNRIDQALK